MQTDSDRVVVLRGGLSVPLSALQLLLDLENRHFSVTVADDGMLEVRPGGCLTDGDRQRIQEQRDELIALVQYDQGTVA